MARLISLSVLLTLIVVLGITFFRVIAPFLLPLFLAGVVAVLSQPLFLYFVRRTNGRIPILARSRPSRLRGCTSTNSGPALRASTMRTAIGI